MKRALVVAGLASVVAVASYLHFSPGSAGCGCGAGNCPCGGGENTAKVSWDADIPTPEEKAPDAGKDKAAPTWTAADLKAAKPLLVYYFVDGLTDAKDDSYKLSQKFEMTGLASDVVLNGIKTSWRAKKVALDAKADRKDAKNQARLEFWSYTGAKMSTIAAKDENQADAKPLATKLTAMAAKNKDLCNAEIKKLEDAAKAPAKTGK
jgi:hypothetical protein